MANKPEYILPAEGVIKRNIVAAITVCAFTDLDKQTPGDDGVDYKPLYYGIFNGISLILENTNTYDQMAFALKQLQCQAEDGYINSGGNLNGL